MDNRIQANLVPQTCAPQGMDGPYLEGLTSRLARRKAQLERELGVVNEAITLMETVPDAGRLMEALSRCGV